MEENQITFDNKLLEKYNTELSQDLSLTIMNLQDKSLRCSGIRTKWLAYLYKEKENLKKIKKAKEVLKTSLIKSASSDLSKDRSILKMKTEDLAVQDNEHMIKLNIALEGRNEVVEYLTYSINILNDFGYNIKNVIELVKLENG